MTVSKASIQTSRYCRVQLLLTENSLKSNANVSNPSPQLTSEMDSPTPLPKTHVRHIFVPAWVIVSLPIAMGVGSSNIPVVVIKDGVTNEKLKPG